MNSKNPQELIDEVQQEQQTRSEVAKQVLQWFLDGNQQELFPRTEVVEQISGELDLSLERAQLGITDTVGDIVDPVQQVISKQKYVGIIDYKVFADEGAYGYVDYDDRRGNRKRVVCARCVERAQYDEEVVHATQGEGSSSEDASWQQLLNKITSHYANSHTKVPENIEPGASLVNGTTISGNTAFHQGNESSINHDSIGGISANDHHSQNHGNEDHNSNYITNAPVDSVNGQTGAVTVSGIQTERFIYSSSGGETATVNNINISNKKFVSGAMATKAITETFNGSDYDEVGTFIEITFSNGNTRTESVSTFPGTNSSWGSGGTTGLNPNDFGSEGFTEDVTNIALGVDNADGDFETEPGEGTHGWLVVLE